MTDFYSSELEAKVIGVIVNREDWRDQIFAQVTADAFYDIAHRRVFAWLLDAHMLGSLDADARDVFTQLMRDGVIEKRDVVTYFSDVLDWHTPVADLVAYRTARKVEKAVRTAGDALEVSPHASAELLGDLRRELDEIDDGAATGERLWTWDELAEDDHPNDWIIPDLIDRDHVVMVTGPNGGGKSTLCLQIAIGAAGGLHPWTALEIEPKRVLVIDAENSPGVVARKKRIAYRMAEMCSDHTLANMRFRFGGVNLANPADQLRLEHHMQSFRPDLVVLGPIYKMYASNGESSWRSEAIGVQTWVDKVRRRYGFGVWIEGHPPKGDGNGQPKGDSSWGSWPYFGFCINLDMETRRRASLTPWRFPREPVRMPLDMEWGYNSHNPQKRLMWAPDGPLQSSEDW